MALSSPYKPSRFISPLKARQLHRALRNLKLSLLCGLLTILVLRGALGAGKFGTPAKDFEEIRYQFERVHRLRTRKHASRVLAEVVEERHRPVEAIEAQAQHSTNYDVLEDAKDKIQGKYALVNGNLAVKSTLDVTKPHALSPRFSDWDAQRRASNPNRAGSKPKLMLVTGYHPSSCENPTGDHYLLKFVKNKVDYCKLHGIEIFYDLALLEAESSGFAAKFRLLRKLMLTHPQVEWFWWMDSDALFTDMAVELPLEKFENYNVVLHGWDDMIYKQKTEVGPTSGSFLIRNCQKSLDMLDTWVTIEPEDGVPVEAGTLLAKSSAGKSNSDDQPMLAHLRIKENRNWGQRVPSEESIYLHGYWEILPEQSEEEIKKNHDNVLNESRLPFMMRFIAHKLCKKGAHVGDYHSDIYLKYMEKVLDSADSQVLQISSLQHKISSSSALQRLRGGNEGIMVSQADARSSSMDQSERRSDRSI